MSAAAAPRPLFGGAITAELPTDVIDSSDLRQVPDNQEVLLSPSSNVTYILEVLQPPASDAKVESVSAAPSPSDDFASLESAIRFHFSALAHDNSALSSEVLQIYALPGTSPAPSLQGQTTPAPLVLVGEQRVAKFNKPESEAERVRIWLALWRLAPFKNVDLVLSVNEPLGDAAAKGTPSEDVENAPSQARDVFTKAAASLQIKDWKLFAQ